MPSTTKISPPTTIYDVAIIGAGLGGLLCARILSMEGYRVVVLEKNKQIGGNLQTFSRDKCIFDTGVHYLGGLGEGQNLHRYFRYFGIMEGLKLLKMDEQGFDRITFEGDEQEYKLAQGYVNFQRSLSKYFPKEEESIKLYCSKIQEVCQHFSLYNVREGAERSIDSEFMSLNTKAFIDSLTENETLRNVLAGNNFLYAGQAEKTPFYVHAMTLDPYLKSAWKCVDGGSQIARILAKLIRSNRGKIIKRQEVSRFVFEGKKIVALKTNSGLKIKAKHFISAIHPVQTIDLVGEGRWRKAYRKRIISLENSLSVFSVHLVFHAKSFPYLNYNCYHYKVKDVWQPIHYQEENWPESYMLSVPASSKSKDWAESMTIMTYMRMEECKPWMETFNTVAVPSARNEAYEAFKKRKAEKLIDEVEKKFPDIRSKIKAVYASSPLSYRDYIGTRDGAMYGIVKDCRNSLNSYISPRTRVPNLLLTGQNLNLHGIVGVTISAVVTCQELLGQNYLIRKIHETEKKI